MTSIETHGGREPSQWYLVFHTRARSRWLAWLAPGRFKHVSAFGYVSGHKVWVLIDANWEGIQAVVYSHDNMKLAFADFVARGGIVVKVDPDLRPMELRSRLGLTCVSAAKHAAHIRSIALTPTGLYHHVLRNGGKIIGSEDTYRPRAANRRAAGSERADVVADGEVDGRLRRAYGALRDAARARWR
jgi:hypothetical protein